MIGSALLPAGSVIGYHTHPGDESGYVLTGNLILKTRGQPDRVLGHRRYQGLRITVPGY